MNAVRIYFEDKENEVYYCDFLSKSIRSCKIQLGKWVKTQKYLVARSNNSDKFVCLNVENYKGIILAEQFIKNGF